MKHIVPMIALCALAACDNDTPPPAGNNNYFPVAVGNRWLYVEKDNFGLAPDMNDTKEIIGMEDLDGEQTYVMLSTPQGRPGVDPITKRFNWLVTEGRVDRVRAEDYSEDVLVETHTYDPGFPRFIDSLQELGDRHVQVVKHICAPTNGVTCLGEEANEFTWSVEAVDAVVTVPAGTFSCIKIRRQVAYGNYKEFWYARGVGKVYEWGDSNYEQLLEYEVAD